MTKFSVIYHTLTAYDFPNVTMWQYSFESQLLGASRGRTCMKHEACGSLIDLVLVKS